MGTSFDRWEKDPFFSAAEEVQESADRMETTYRTWVHSMKEPSSMWNTEELSRDLRTALGTTKWQLEEFEQAVLSSYVKRSGDDARDRHHEFIVAIQDHTSRIEKSLNESATSEDKSSASTWVRLDEGERDELALFLSGPTASVNNVLLKDQKTNAENPLVGCKDTSSSSSKISSNSVEQGSSEAREEKCHGHRRAASANADISSWKIAISEVDQPLVSSHGEASRPPQRTPSLSVILSTVESASKFKWPKNGARKWKARDNHQKSDVMPLTNLHLAEGMDECCEKSKSCLDGCDEYYDKQLYGWYGALQRQLQRSQYQMQYNRPVQVALSTVLFLFLIVLVASQAL